jgi:hypothetical protein
MGASTSPPGAARRRVVVYVLARHCPLCDDALALLRDAATRRPLDVRVVPIDGDPRLSLRHALRVPVVEIDGVEALFGRVTREALEAALDGKPVERRT